MTVSAKQIDREVHRIRTDAANAGSGTSLKIREDLKRHKEHLRIIMTGFNGVASSSIFVH